MEIRAFVWHQEVEIPNVNPISCLTLQKLWEDLACPLICVVKTTKKTVEAVLKDIVFICI